MKYWDRAWNPVSGCTECGDGCKNCIAKRLIEKRKKTEQGLNFNVKVNIKQLMKRFDDEPEVIMVASQGDLFHPDVDTKIIDSVIRKCVAIKNKRFLILTRRAERMMEYLNDPGLISRLRRRHKTFSFENMAFGVSVESGKYVYRIDFLKNCSHINHRFVVFEPLLDIFDYSGYLDESIEWAVIGAETSDDGTHRPCLQEWIEYLVNICDQKHIKVFVNNMNINGEVTDDFQSFPESCQRDERLFE